ncbi:type III secretion system inner membrane ring lipoprotein SctJ [Pectobacterium brasiliense]|uniref:type III secretion system inner membrane ring lipoprotein SctJ n=1 Tax=Pectobacterium brasiliense TaxID=180957 RepID=UPI001968C653|nr:type III secretion inner membrane ring lipoprotein SctJ [Pectobacterium brasiliense]MBN3264697.1 type III secretion inner membrane ring lipoprotein SctJ [Pectobacterium brasiliense]
MIKKTFQMVGILFTVLMLSACSEDAVLNDLTQEQANQALAILQQHNIAAKKNGTLKSGYTITVDNTEVTAAHSIISQYKLPWSADVQIANAFPDSSLVSSPNAEQARVISLQEQRLEQSLKIITQIVNAKVHISYPSFINEVGNKKTNWHVGILISFKGEIDENTFISKIKLLIKNSVDDVRYENISVVLFPAPLIQYASPIKSPASTPSLWTILLIAIATCATAITSYVIYKTSRQPPVAQKNNNMEKDDEPLEKDKGSFNHET